MDTPQQQMQRLLTSIPALTREDVVALIPLAAALQSGLSVQLLTLPMPFSENPNQLLTTKEAAHRLGISPRQLYRRADEFPFTVREFGGLRFHAGRLSQYIASQEKGQ